MDYDEDPIMQEAPSPSQNVFGLCLSKGVVHGPTN